MTIERLRPPDVVGLEIWDLVVDGRAGVLSDWIGAPEVAEVLAAAVDSLRPTEGFDAVYVTGGGAAGLVLPGAHVVDRDGMFAGEKGAAELGAGAETLVVDVGQTGIKMSFEGRRARVERPVTGDRWSRGAGEAGEPGSRPAGIWPVPTPAPAPVPVSPLLPFLTDSLAAFLTARPEKIILALPCTLDSTCRPGPCTYPDLTETLVPDLLARLGLSTVPTLLLNDAELAALSARPFATAAGARKTLVLTIGFGVGGALLLAPPAPRPIF